MNALCGKPLLQFSTSDDQKALGLCASTRNCGDDAQLSDQRVERVCLEIKHFANAEHGPERDASRLAPRQRLGQSV